MDDKFRVIFLEDAKKFLDGVEERAREKILFNIIKSQIITDAELFKKITSEIWEFRTYYNKKYYRLFAFWDKTDRQDTIVVSTNGLINKTSKTPRSEIERAEASRINYFKSKNKL